MQPAPSGTRAYIPKITEDKNNHNRNRNNQNFQKRNKDNLNNLKEHATSQFSSSARMAFISKYILDCSVTDNLLTKNDLIYFYNWD